MDTKEASSASQKLEIEAAQKECDRLREQRKEWFDNVQARLEELEDQKLHNHLMGHMEQTDVDFKRALLEHHCDEKADFMQVDGKLVNAKRRKGKNVEEMFEHELQKELTYDHIHGGILLDAANSKSDDTSKIEDEEKRKKAIEEKCQNEFKNEMAAIDLRIKTQKQLDSKTMLKQSKRADNKKMMKSGPWNRGDRSKNDVERFAEGKEYYSDNSDDDIGYVGYAEKSFETKIKTDFMRKLSKELHQLIKDEINKDIGEYQFINKNDNEVNPFEAFFKKRDKPGLFDSQPSQIDETSSQDGSVWSNDYGKKSVFTITSKTPSSKINTTPSEILMRSDHSRTSGDKSKKSKVKFFDLDDSDCGQI